MSMYLSNSDLHPTGWEAAEFIEPDVILLPPERPLSTDTDTDTSDGAPTVEPA
jgi:hypothetical protein